MKQRLLKTDEIKLNILQHLNKNTRWHSYYDLQRNLNINYDSLKLHLYFLEKLGLVELIIIPSDQSSTGKGSYRVKINENGRSFLNEWE